MHSRRRKQYESAIEATIEAGLAPWRAELASCHATIERLESENKFLREQNLALMGRFGATEPAIYCEVCGRPEKHDRCCDKSRRF